MNDRRRNQDPVMEELIDSVAAIRADQAQSRAEQAEIRAEQKLLREKIEKNSEENEIIIEFFKAGRATFKFFGMVGNLIKWVGAVAAAIAVIWAVFTHTPGK